MDYQGEVANIPLGQGGLFTDSPQNKIAPTFLIDATNVTYYNDIAEKDYGCRKWHQTALPAGIRAISDFWPSDTVQRVSCVLNDGRVYRFLNYNNSYEQVTASGAAPANLIVNGFVTLVEGGAEESARNKKLFIFTGNNPVQVISGDSNVRTNISRPAADWSGTNQPFCAIKHRSRLFAFGNRNDPHRIYLSLATDNEDFTTTPTSYSIFPGEGEKLIGGGVFRGRLFVGKFPKGLYYLDDSDASPTNWFFNKFSDDIGWASPNAFLTVLDDALMANDYGGITSLKAALVFGDVTTSDLFHQCKVFNYVDNEIQKGELTQRYGIYYALKKRVYFTFKSNSSAYYNRICTLDFKNMNQPPRISWSTKDQPNCLALMKDNFKLSRPFYGSNDGFIYQMDQVDRWVGDSTAYSFDITTPAIDFGSANPSVSEQNKFFDFLQVVYEPTGDWDLNIDVFIDGIFQKTYTCNMSGRTQLNSAFLNDARLDTAIPFSSRFPLNGTGKRISFRLYNSGVGENVKISELKLYYRWSGTQQTK